MRVTDVADMQGIFRIIQSIPSPKAEPFKMWLAEEHIQVAKRGGNVAKVAKETLEKETGKPVITPKNAVDLSRLIEDVASRADARAEDS